MRMRYLAAAMVLSVAVAAAAPVSARADEPRTGQTAEAEAGQETGRAVEAEAGQETGQAVEAEAGQETGQAVEAEAGQETGRAVEAEARQEIGRAVEAEAGQETGQAVEAWAGQQTGQVAAEGQETEKQYTRLHMLPSVSNAQLLSVIIRSENGRLVVIDGGWESDGERLLETIKQYGGRVDAWLLTHPHDDHAGALCYILENKSDEIAIDNIYCSLAESEWYWKVSPGDGPMVDRLKAALSRLPEGILHDQIGKDVQTDVDNLHITVLNDRYRLSSDPVNNSSMVYMVDTGEKKMLFLGDMGDMGGQYLLKTAGDKLKADIVQMAHHGQNGVNKEVYKTVAPSICLWPTPQWLWDNDNGGGYNSGPWRTLETRTWIESLNVEQNYVIKDGDIILQVE